MNALPKKTMEFLDKKYWDKFFSKVKKESESMEYFEWYGEFKDFAKVFRTIIGDPSTNPKIMNLGCGKSLFSENMYDEGYQHIANIDFSEKVIEGIQAQTSWTRIEPASV